MLVSNRVLHQPPLREGKSAMASLLVRENNVIQQSKTLARQHAANGDCWHSVDHRILFRNIMKIIFVFGSNLAGRHGKGAAKFAREKYGAVYGVGEGITGNAYAIPTKDEHLDVLPFSQVDEGICRFLKYAKAHPECLFLLTPIGTGLAGYSKESVWNVLTREGVSDNVVLAKTWLNL